MIDTLDSFYAHLDMLEHPKSESSHAAHIAEVTFMNNSGLEEYELSGSARCKEMVTLSWKIGIRDNYLYGDMLQLTVHRPSVVDVYTSNYHETSPFYSDLPGRAILLRDIRQRAD